MSGEIVISVEHIGKAYRIWDTPASRLVSPLIAGLARLTPSGSRVEQSLQQRASRDYRDFYALRDVSFTVSRGESVGIIGRNGSGKSTLLQIIAGTLQATEGRAEVKGRVAALLELGSGFNPEFTGRENVYLTGSILGFSAKEMDERFDAIASFADIGDFIEQPVKVYSSGMMVRLAFAVQTAVEPDVLIIDEALGVGDFFFQQKCAARMRALRERGTTLLFVSHDLGSVRDLCQQALYLRKGRAEYWGDTQEAVARYYGEATQSAEAAPPPTVRPTNEDPADYIRSFRERALWWNENLPETTASDPVELLGVALLDPHGSPVTKLPMGSELVFTVLFRARRAGEYHVALELKNRYDQVMTSTGSYPGGLKPLPLQAGETAGFELSMQLSFEAGRYTCQVVLGSHGTQPNRGQRLAASPWLGPIEIAWDYENERAPFLGMFGPSIRSRFLADLRQAKSVARNSP